MAHKILVLDPESGAGLETVQSLGSKGCIIHTVSLYPEQSRHSSSFITKRLDVSNPDVAIPEALVNLYRNEEYDLIVPSTEISLLALLSPVIPDDMYERAVLPARHNLRRALDKQQVWCVAQQVGVRTPHSELVSFRDRPPQRFPVVLKPIQSKKHDGKLVKEYRVTIARDEQDWNHALTSTYGEIAVQQQEYIVGKGVGVEMLFDHGTPRWLFLHERVHEVPLTGGGSSYRVSIEAQGELVHSATSLLSALNWHGVAMVEYKVTPSGKPYLMEINPRLWGSLALAIDAGVDFPLGLLYMSTGTPLPPQPNYRAGYYTRNVRRDVEWFKANIRADRSDPLLLTKPILTSFFELLRPLVGKESWDFFSWSDLPVVMGEMRAAIAENWLRLASRIRRKFQMSIVQRFEQPRLIRRLQKRRINRVLFLCHGNICRSPLAAQIATLRYPHAEISSAGFYPANGRSSPEFMLSAAKELGVDLSQHRSTRVDARMIETAEVVVIMDFRNYQSLEQEFPESVRKTLLLGMLLPDSQLEITDPYDNPAMALATARQIQCAIEQMQQFLT